MRRRPPSHAASGGPDAPPASRRGAPRRRLRPAAAAGALAAAALVAAPLAAGDQRITGSVTQRVIGDSNVQLEDGDGASVGSITSLSLGYLNRTPTETLSLGTALNYSFFSGSENDDISGLFPRVNGAYSVRRQTRSFRLNFSGSVTPVDFFSTTDILLPGSPEEPDFDPDPDPEDPDAPPPEPEPEAPEPEPVETTSRTVRDEALRVILNAGFGYQEAISSRESISFGASAGRTDYIDGNDTLTPNTSFSVNGGWSRRLTSDASAGVSAGASVFFSENDQNRTTWSLRIGPSGTYNRTARETFSFNIGPSFNYSTFDRRLAGGGTVEETETSVSAAGSAAFTFAGDVDRLSARLSQSVQPDDDGAIVNSTSLSLGWGRRLTQAARLNTTVAAVFRSDPFSDNRNFEDRFDYRAAVGWNYRVNPRNSARLSAFASRNDDGAGDLLDLVTGVGAGWSYAVAPRTNANVGYDFRYEREGGVPSHRVSFSLSHGFTLLP